MEQAHHPICELFAQLGLPTTADAVDRFIARHSPLAAGVVLADATFWSSTQAAFLREETAEDADWSAVVDELNHRLRA